MNRVVLQVPIETSLRQAAEREAQEQGFSSLQEVVRVFLRQFSQKDLVVSFENQTELSPKAAKRYKMLIEKIKSGKIKLERFDSASELVKYLNE